MRFFAAWILLSGVVWGQQDEKPGFDPTQPQEGKPQEREKQIFITESPLNPKDVHHIPRPADVVTSEDQLRKGVRTTPDLLKEVPGVSVQKTGVSQGSPFIRGWTGFRNVLLIDGIRLNNSVFREGPNQYWGTVDPFLIERLEVVRGPSSVLYGSDSIGGTAAAYTQEPWDFESGLHARARSYYRYATAEHSHTGRQEVHANQDDLGFLVGGTVRNFGDLRGGEHVKEQRDTGYEEYAGDAKVVYRLSKDSKLVFAVQRLRQHDAPRWHSTDDSNDQWQGTAPGTDLRRDFEQERDLYYVQYHAKMEGGPIDAFKASLSWHRQAEKENRLTSSSTRQIREFDVRTPALWVQAGKKTEWGYFTAGAEYYRDEVNSSGHNWTGAGALQSFERGNVADEATYDLLGVYLQDEISVGSLDVTPGIRFSWAKAAADEVQRFPGDPLVSFTELDETYSAVTGSLRLLYHVDEHWNVLGGWGMGFRAPGLSDSTSMTIALSGVQEVPVEGLDPEFFHSLDAGVRARYQEWTFGAFAFYTIIDGMITRVVASPGPPPVFTRDNAGDGYVYGFELSALYRVTEEVSVYADWGYAKGEVDTLVSTGPDVESEQPLGKVGPSLVHLGVRYEPKDQGWWVEALGTAARHQHHIPPQEGPPFDNQRIPPNGTPGYGILTLRGGFAYAEQYRITMAVENVFNKDHRVHGSGQNEAGTNFVIGAEVRF